MSLLVDTDYVIYSLRLAYLRRIEDRHGPRVITLPNIAGPSTTRGGGASATNVLASLQGGMTSGTSTPGSLLHSTMDILGPRIGPDSHVVLGGLNDPEIHPEITSIQNSAHTSRAPSPTHTPFGISPPTSFSGGLIGTGAGKPGAGRRSSKGGATGLTYTQTIYAPGRTPALGMRTSGKRLGGTDEPVTSYKERRNSRINQTTPSWTPREPPSPRSQSAAAIRNDDSNTIAGPPLALARPGVQPQHAHSISEGGDRIAPFHGTLPTFAIHAGTSDTQQTVLFDQTPVPSVSTGLNASVLATSTSATPRYGSSSPTQLWSDSSNVNQGDGLGGARRSSGVETDDDSQHPSGTSDIVGARRRSASEGEIGQPDGGNEQSQAPTRPLLRSTSLREVLLTHRLSGAHMPETSTGRKSFGTVDSTLSELNASQSEDGAGSAMVFDTSEDESNRAMSELDSDFEELRGSTTGHTTGSAGSNAIWASGSLQGSVLNAEPKSSASSSQRRARLSVATAEGNASARRKPMFTPVTEVDEPNYPDGSVAGAGVPAPAPILEEAINDASMRRSRQGELSSGSRDASSLAPSDSLGGFNAGMSSDEAVSLVVPGQVIGPTLSTDAGGLARVHPAFDTPSAARSPAVPAPAPLYTPPPSGSLPEDSSHVSLRPEVIGASGEVVPVKEGTPQISPAPRRTRSTRKLSGRTSADASAVRTRTARSRSKAPAAGQNEWFASLKSDQATVAARHAAQPKVSKLSSMLRSQGAEPANPLAAYAAVAGRASTSPFARIDMYFPFASARNPQPAPGASLASRALSLNAKTKSMRLCVRKDVCMEELIGYSLWAYIEEGWEPKLEQGFENDDEAREARLSTLGWTLRIVEDGEVDDDYPAIDRSLSVGKFGGDEFAVCAATDAQIKQHRAAAPSATRLRSLTAAKSSIAVPTQQNPQQPQTISAVPTSGRLAVAGLNAPPAGSLISVQGTPIFASSMLSRSAVGPSSASIFLRVLIKPNEEVQYKTTLQVPSDMYLADVLELICKKRHLTHADEWALVVPEKGIVVPLDRTVESLQGNHDLALVRRETLGAQGGVGALKGQSTDPNASIFKRFSEPAQPRYKQATDISAAYKTYTISRRMPMFVGRHEQVLTLDGDWLHIMPSDTRAFQTKAASFHITSVQACKQSTKVPSSFKLYVTREATAGAGGGGETKRYDFEADNVRIATEIVQGVERLRQKALGVREAGAGSGGGGVGANSGAGGGAGTAVGVGSGVQTGRRSGAGSGGGTIGSAAAGRAELLGKSGVGAQGGVGPGSTTKGGLADPKRPTLA